MSIEWSSFFFFISKLKGNACAHLSWMVYVVCSVWCFFLHIILEFMQVLKLNWKRKTKKKMNKTISYSSKPRTFAWNAENVFLCVRCVNQNDDRAGEHERERIGQRDSEINETETTKQIMNCFTSVEHHMRWFLSCRSHRSCLHHSKFIAEFDFNFYFIFTTFHSHSSFHKKHWLRIALKSFGQWIMKSHFLCIFKGENHRTFN